MSKNKTKYFQACLGLLLSINLILPFSNCKTESEKAMEYKKRVVGTIKTITEIAKQIDEKDGPELEKLILKLKKEIKASKTQLEESDSFKDDNSLKEACMEICDFYQEIVDGKWGLRGQPAIEKKKEDLYKNLNQKEIDFAKKFNFNLD